MNVRVPAGWASGREVPERVLRLERIELSGDERWRVFDGLERIGYVWKGHRTWSPPTHRGSRIVRFHRRVPEWHGSRSSHYSPDYRKDTRAEVLRELIALRS